MQVNDQALAGDGVALCDTLRRGVGLTVDANASGTRVCDYPCVMSVLRAHTRTGTVTHIQKQTK